MGAFCEHSYLNRINLSAKPTLNPQGLKDIHHAQHKTIPFENFDVAVGKGINLDPELLVNKLVHSKRGGYCFELNGLLLMALRHFGFNARALLGRVHLSGNPTGRGHQLILVDLQDSQWIVDAGFGSQTPRAPLPLALEKELHVDRQIFRFIEHDLYGFMLQMKAGEEWNNLYSFDLCHVCKGDIEYGNHFTSTALSSVFVSSCVAYLPTPEGGISLLNRTLKTDNQGVTTSAELTDDAYISALNKYFGIELDSEFKQLIPLN